MAFNLLITFIRLKPVNHEKNNFNFAIAAGMFVACNLQRNEPIKVKSEEMDAVCMYDMNRNYMRDTLIEKESLTK